MTTTARPGATPFDDRPFPAAPGLACDIVMKGGITSGVMYPWAVCELAQTYRLSSVGGASAGAIAAAAAAAAEVGRGSGGFESFAQFPLELNSTEDGVQGSLLFRLFAPSIVTRRLHALLVSGLRRKDGLAAGGLGARLALLGDVVTTFPAAALLGALPGLLALLLAVVVLVGAVGASPAWPGVVGGILLVVVGLAVLVLGSLAGVVRSVLGDVRRLPEQGFGLCTGMPDARLGAGTALTPWLEKRLQELAGRPVDGPPLTFGDLDAAGVRLRMMTTDLSSSRPRTMPWDGREFFFDPQRFRDYFPDRVVQHMVEHPSPLPTQPAAMKREQELRAQAAAQKTPLVPWPAAADLPVIVATRMSLSFPVLISAVPLHALDTSATPPAFEEHWFSDGGLCSNLPVHFFDSALPSHPTFAINLAERGTVDPDEARNVYLPDSNRAGVLRGVRNPAPGSGPSFGSLGWFAGSLLETARVWVDEGQLVMPGYRDRVVRIFHTKAEGGLNLDMEQDVVSRLSERGRQAAVQLRDRFAPSAPGAVSEGFDNHRWVRYRAAMAGLDDWLASWSRAFGELPAGTTSYATLLAGRVGERGGAYAPANQAAGAAMLARTGQLADLASAWAEDPADAFTGGRPRPEAALRLVPDDAGAQGTDRG